MGTRKLPSGRWQARFKVNGNTYSDVWDTQRQATAWEQRTRRELARGIYVDPRSPADPTAAITFAEYAATWLAARTLKPRTRAEYTRMLKRTSDLDTLPLSRITRDTIRAWHRDLHTGPVHKAHIYALVKAILGTAVDEERIPANPCAIRGASAVKRKPLPELPTAHEVHAIADAMPAKHRVMVLVAAWCGLRLGELLELRRKDVRGGALHVRRAVSRVDGAMLVDTPKTAAGVRTVAVPPHILGDLQAHLAGLPKGGEALLFPGADGHMGQSTLRAAFKAAAAKVGYPDLTLHGLRHFAATEAARSGATLAELQARLGHSTPAMAMRYQHASAGRDRQVAEAMSARLAEALSNVVPMPAPKVDEFATVWVRQVRGAWHLAGGTPSSTWCGRRLSIANGALEQRHGDQPRGRVCSRCGRRASA